MVSFVLLSTCVKYITAVIFIIFLQLRRIWKLRILTDELLVGDNDVVV